MAKSKVYFTNLRTKPNQNLLKKLEILISRAGIGNIDFSHKLVALKIHFGEPGNLAYLRPNYAAQVVRYLKSKDAVPFLTDCNTLYWGRRANGPSHLDAAFENGFNPMVTGCPVVIADGIKGTEYREIEVGLELCQSAKIGSAVADADVIISLNHFKGHELTGFGGALKNLGMGCASVGGKLFLHSGSSPEIYEENCTGCRICEKYCAHDAVKVEMDKKAHINYDNCVGCGQCVAVCQYDSARVVWQNSSETVSKKVTEYAFAAIKGKPSFHINFIMNVSPNCDCWDSNDYPIVQDLGIAASFDPVAIDKASADLVTAAPALPGSRICDKHDPAELNNKDKFKIAHPDTSWQAGIEHGVRIGLGSSEYDLIVI
jgi:uncharacterized Fe-S center protein